MNLLTPHFTWAEVVASPTAAAKGIDNTLPSFLVENARYCASLAEKARAILGVPMAVSSWYRCPELNKAVGGSRTSKHMEALAIDFNPVGISREAAFDALAESDLPFDQLIEEQTSSGKRWIHLGFSRYNPRRQVMRARGTDAANMTYTRVAPG